MKEDLLPSFERTINRLLDCWEYNARWYYTDQDRFIFKTRYPDIEFVPLYIGHHEAFLQLYDFFTRREEITLTYPGIHPVPNQQLPENFVTYCFYTWRNFNNGKLSKTKKGNLKEHAGIGFPSINWLVKNYVPVFNEFVMFEDWNTQGMFWEFIVNPTPEEATYPTREQREKARREAYIASLLAEDDSVTTQARTNS